jgi:hypothetical protein
MVQTSVQFTPVQVLQAARRAEAEGKMDYALQFYRHLVEQHGGTPEAQEAREGLFRIAEWRWGEARVARSREGGNAAAGAQPSQGQTATPPPAGQRVYNVSGGQAANEYPPDTSANAGPVGMPQIIQRQHSQANDTPAFHPRFAVAKFIAHSLSGIGWLAFVAGVFTAVAGIAGLVGELSATPMFDTPIGVMIAVPSVLLGLVLIVGGQLAAALFDSVNATLEMSSRK